MRFPKPLRSLALAGFVAAAVGLTAQAGLSSTAGVPRDPLAAELERLSAYVKDNPAKDENWTGLKSAVEPLLERSRTALASGRRYLALLRLAPARVNLDASRWSAGRPAAEREQEAGFEAAWKRMGEVLHADLQAPRASSLDGIAPAAVRAVAEASLPQIRAYYEAALEYGRATQPGTGLYYVGLAQAQKDLVAFCRTLSTRGGPPAPALRSLAPDLDALETELLALYQPPASIDRHSDFIGASATLKEARELDAAGLRYGAMLRFLLAAQRVAALKPAPSETAEQVKAALGDFEKRIDSRQADHTIARVFVEAAQADLDGTSAPVGGAAQGAAAAAIVKDVLPRYFAALSPAAPRKAPAGPQVTVTLVRWPYT
jgi:hypothetical protein